MFQAQILIFGQSRGAFDLLFVQDRVVLDHLVSPEPADLDLHGIKERL